MTTTIAAKAGRAFVLKVSDGTSPTTFSQIAGLRNTQFAVNNNPVDITNAGSAGFREWLPDGGVQDIQVSADGIVDETDADFDLLEAAAFNRTAIEAQIVSGHGDAIAGEFVVTSFQRTGAFDGAETFSVTLASNG